MNENGTTVALIAAGLALLWGQCAAGADGGSLSSSATAQHRRATRVSRPPSPFVQLASAVARGPATERAAFARTALLTMAGQYGEEIGKARDIPYADPKLRRKVARWSAATLDYLDELYAIAERIDDYTAVEVVAGPGNSVQLLVDGIPVVVSGPRITDPDALGRSIVEEYCRLRKCDFDAPADQDIVAEAHRPPDDTRTGWDFTDASGSTFVTVDGIHFMFTSARDRKRKQQAAMAIVYDLRSLTDALRAAMARGHDVDWDLIRLESAPVAGEQKVVINRHGDYLMLRLPSLSRVAAALVSSRSWIKGRAEGREVRQDFPRAESLLAPFLEG